MSLNLGHPNVRLLLTGNTLGGDSPSVGSSATSASRWLDGYFTYGWEWDDDGTSTTTHTMTEAGIKLRFNIGTSPVRFLSSLTDFWGLRIGVKNIGIWDWEHIGYAVEVGAGVW